MILCVLFLITSRYLWINLYITPTGNESSVAAEVRQVATDGTTSSHFLLRYFTHTHGFVQGAGCISTRICSPSYPLLLSLRIIPWYWTENDNTPAASLLDFPDHKYLFVPLILATCFLKLGINPADLAEQLYRSTHLNPSKRKKKRKQAETELSSNNCRKKTCSLMSFSKHEPTGAHSYRTNTHTHTQLSNKSHFQREITSEVVQLALNEPFTETLAQNVHNFSLSPDEVDQPRHAWCLLFLNHTRD